MTTPKSAVLDGDIIAYKAAYAMDEEGPADSKTVRNIVKFMLKRWIPDGIKDYTIALSCSRHDNFRRKVWPRYKLHRDAAYTPSSLSEIKDHIRTSYIVREYDNIEADDIMGILASSETDIAVTIDKDLRGVPGWHWNPSKEDAPVFIEEEEAERFFYKQWMTGDNTDGIPGLWRIGPKKADKFLDKWDQDTWDSNIIDMYTTDKHRPRKTCDLEDYELALAMARCVYILHKNNYNFNNNTVTLWSPKGGP